MRPFSPLQPPLASPLTPPRPRERDTEEGKGGRRGEGNRTENTRDWYLRGREGETDTIPGKAMRLRGGIGRERAARTYLGGGGGEGRGENCVKST